MSLLCLLLNLRKFPHSKLKIKYSLKILVETSHKHSDDLVSGLKSRMSVTQKSSCSYKEKWKE